MQIASAAAVLVKAIGFLALLLLKVAVLLVKAIGIVAVLLVQAIGFLISLLCGAADRGGAAEPRVSVREHTRSWPGSKS